MREVEAAHPGERVEVWFEDEARFGQKGSLTTVWAERGSRPTAPKQTAYANLQVLTAACPATGRAEGLAAERAGDLRRRLEAGPTPADGTCAFHGEDVRRILEKEFGVLMKLSAVYGLLHRLGYSRLCPRPRHPQADPAAREVFKKRR